MNLQKPATPRYDTEKALETLNQFVENHANEPIPMHSADRAVRVMRLERYKQQAEALRNPWEWVREACTVSLDEQDPQELHAHLRSIRQFCAFMEALQQ